MISRFTFGTPVYTGSCVQNVPASQSNLCFGKQIEASLAFQSGNPSDKTDEHYFAWQYTLENDDQIFGLGENVRGINKRGFTYTSWCTDCPDQSASSESLYGAHNFLIVRGRQTFGVFFDYAGKITFDCGFTKRDLLTVKATSQDIDLYFILPEKDTNPLYDIIRQFRHLIGQSYIAPFWAFGFFQSRWGYATGKDVQHVVDTYRKNQVPIEGVCMDIDYMVDFKDFSLDTKKFPDFKNFVNGLKDDHIHLVPIVDAGVKEEKGYDIYDEGMKNGYFCRKADGSEFIGGVWPGAALFPDFLNADVRKWFGSKYRMLTDCGIEGFWNDMNEPAIFYSEDNLKECLEEMDRYKNRKLSPWEYFTLGDRVRHLSNNAEDYKRFWHNQTQPDGTTRKIRHDQVHNLYGANMTQAASEGLEQIAPGKRFLLFSRASTIGAHRYGGIWTGDNGSVWDHLAMGLKMMPSLNMCGFMFTGTDTGGFGNNTSRDLLLRWLAFSVFTPLMRDHSALGTREQECYQFEDQQDFASVIELRYRLLPYIYSEYMKAVLKDELLFKPMAFEWPEDRRACHTEDQLLLGDSVMIAPVVEQNAYGRMVYLPEDMLLVRWSENHIAEQTMLCKGDHFIEVPLADVVFFVRKNHAIPFMTKQAFNSYEVDYNSLELIGQAPAGTEYQLYKDDGVSKNISLENIVVMKK